MTYTTKQAVALAKEVGAIWMHPYDYGSPRDRMILKNEELTALCNKVRTQTLLEAAEFHEQQYGHCYELRRMAEGVE